MGKIYNKIWTYAKENPVNQSSNYIAFPFEKIMELLYFNNLNQLNINEKKEKIS